ncbi:MAG: ABC transporter permease, partial [Bacteroidota bacterium]|nr:ABC transporter permease [Bacteroidota bacterium]
MLKSYFVISIRNLVRHKVFSFINLFGLALGMSGALLIGLWVQDEQSFNNFYPDLDRLYYVRMQDGDYTSEITSSPLAEALKADIPEVEKATKLSWSQELLLTAGEKSFKEAGYYASADFFDVFQFPVVRGNPRTALQSLTTIIITRKLADKYFGTLDVIGKTIRLDNGKDYLVGAVIENVPFHSTVRFDWIVNFKVFEEDWMHNWNNNSFQTFVKLRPKVTAA